MDPSKEFSLTPTSCKDLANKSINKALLTPCRSVGLKRKTSSLKKIDSTSTSNSPNEFTPNPMKISRHFNSDIREKLKKRKLDLCGKKIGHKSEIVNPNIGVSKTEITDLKKISTSCATVPEYTYLKELSKESLQSDYIGESPIRESSRRLVPSEITNEIILNLVKNIKRKEMKLSSVEKIDVYAKKHNPEELKELIIKWKRGCQDALREIQSLLNGKGLGLSMAQVLDQFQVPYCMVDFNLDCDEFED